MTMTDETVAPTADSERFNIKDGQRPVTFVGWSVASANSQSGSDTRWTELAVYRTLTGKYVLEKVGRSDVFHEQSCKRRGGKRFDTLDDAFDEKSDDDEDELDDVFAPCDQCAPSFETAPTWVEQDIFSAAVYESADAFVASLYRHDGNGMRYLSRIARLLLDDASKSDPNVAAVLNAPSDVT